MIHPSIHPSTLYPSIIPLSICPFPYCHSQIEKLFHVGQEVPCRVTGYRPMDHLCTVSMKKSIMQQSVVSMKELTPGQAVSGVVKEVTANALYVELAPGVKGRVAAMHMAGETRCRGRSLRCERWEVWWSRCGVGCLPSACCVGGGLQLCSSGM